LPQDERDYYVVAQHEEDGLLFQLVIPRLWADPVKEGVIGSSMSMPQVLVTRK
jgi:hypothetical protein